MGKILNVFLNILLVPYKIFTGKSIFSYADFKSLFLKKVRYKRGSRIHNSRIGRYSYLGNDCLVINADIGSFCSISSGCVIGLGSHPLDRVSTSPVFIGSKNIFRTSFAHHPFEEFKKTAVGNDVWIGADVLIRSGVVIGDGAVIGAGSIVTKDVPPYAIVAGNPAKIIRYRFDEDTVSALLRSQWWLFSTKQLKMASCDFDSPQRFLKKHEDCNNL